MDKHQKELKNIFVIFQKDNGAICHIRYSLKEAEDRAKELCREHGGEWLILWGIRKVKKLDKEIIIQNI